MADPTTRATEKVFLASATAGAGGAIAAPFQFLMTGEDRLLVTAWSDDGTIDLAVHGRFLKRSGEIQPFVYVCRSAATVAGRNTPIDLGEGYLLNLALAIDGSAAIPWGRAYGRVNVVRGTQGPSIVLGSMIAGYVASGTLLAWPGSPIQYPWEGAGFLEWQSMPDNVAGLAPQATAGAIQRWQIIAVRTTLQAIGTFSTRKPFVAVRQAGFDFLRVYLPAFLVGGQTMLCQWSAGMGGAEAVSDTDVLGALPDPFWILPTQTVIVIAGQGLASDVFSDSRYLRRQYLSIP